MKRLRYNLHTMFKSKTPRIEKLLQVAKYKATVEKLEGVLTGKVNVYIDYANVRPWVEKLEWHVEPRKLRQFLKSFDNVDEIKFYQGELLGDPRSESEIKKLEECKYIVRTKPVKIMKFSIDTTSISTQSPDLLKRFVKSSLLRKLDIETIEFLNKKFASMNAQGIHFIEDRKCNFDVEIGTDMRIDHIKDGIETFVLWSGDSDFADPIKTLLDEGKKVVLFATAGKIARELSELVQHGLFIFDIYELKDFICWIREEKVPN
jgi:uncharacterized LabA/DUF88 family protein